MNMWGFPLAYLRALEEKFPAFLQKTVRENPLKGEFYLPVVVDELLREDAAEVQVLHSADTVSYTHLDVYKRQHDSTRFWRFQHR